MKLDKQHFCDQYASLTDEQLAHIATTAQLIPLAKECLDAELSKRGITDLSPYKITREHAVKGLEAKWEARQARSSRAQAMGGRLGYAACALMILYGVYIFLFPGTDKSAGEGVMFIVLGIIFSGMIWVIVKVVFKIERLWQTRVADRPWWR